MTGARRRARTKAPAAGTPGGLVSQAEYARRRGVSRNAVHVAVQMGRIRLNGRKIDPAQADRDWKANTDTSKPRNSLTGTPIPVSSASARPKKPAPAGKNGAATAGGTYSTHRGERELWAARRAELEYKRLAGETLPTSDVEEAVFKAVRQARDQLLAIPRRLAPLVAAIADPIECERRMEEEIRRICESLARGLEPDQMKKTP